jgi:hypothetical protein
VVNGDVPDFGVPMFAPGAVPAPPGPLGEVIASVLGLPEGIGIDEVVGRPTGQLNP